MGIHIVSAEASAMLRGWRRVALEQLGTRIDEVSDGRALLELVASYGRMT